MTAEARREAQLLMQELQSAYVACIDENELDDWPDFFTDDCHYNILPRENYNSGLASGLMLCDGKAMLRDRVVYFREAAIYAPHSCRHLISMPRILEAANGVLRAETNYVVFRTRNDGDSSVFQVGKYLDTAVETADGFKFKEKVAVYDTNRVHSFLARPV